MTELSGRELLGEWQRLMDSLVSSASALAGRSEIPRQLLEPMQRQLELVQEIVERERRLQRELVGRLTGPLDTVFDLLEQSGTALRRQAEALEGAGQALEETAALMKSQAELFERTIAALRQPADFAKAAASLDLPGSGSVGRRPAGRRDAGQSQAGKRQARKGSRRDMGR